MLRIVTRGGVFEKFYPKTEKYALSRGGPAPAGSSRPASERHNYGIVASSIKLSDSAAEEEKLRKLYDQARAQGNKKKKKEYKEKIAELNRLRKSVQRESNRSKS
jgi:hypothetical protein